MNCGLVSTMISKPNNAVIRPLFGSLVWLSMHKRTESRLRMSGDAMRWTIFDRSVTAVLTTWHMHFQWEFKRTAHFVTRICLINYNFFSVIVVSFGCFLFVPFGLSVHYRHALLGNMFRPSLLSYSYLMSAGWVRWDSIWLHDFPQSHESSESMCK